MLNFLFNDPLFPRSVAHCLDAIEESLGNLDENTVVMKRLRAVYRVLRQIDTEQLSQAALHQVVDEIQLAIMEIHDALGRVYFLRQYDTSQTQIQKQG